MHLRDDAGLVAELRRLDGTQSQVLEDEELLRMVLDAIRTDYKAVETYAYRPGPPLAAPVTVLVGDDDPTTTLEEAQGWRDFTRGAFELKVFTGGHFYLNAHQAEILRVITSRLAFA
ncbi:thioesterase II family protein [Streptosporangium lutulentum]